MSTADADPEPLGLKDKFRQPLQFRVNTGYQDPLKGWNWRQSPPYAMLPLPLNGGDLSG
jgi:hypothetical protein